MQQYSEKNQQWLYEQAAERGMVPPTDVKSFKAWAAEGRRVKKGEKALKVWCPITRRPKAGEPKQQRPSLDTATDAEIAVWFKAGHVFDVSQTETMDEWKARKVAEEFAVEEGGVA